MMKFRQLDEFLDAIYKRAENERVPFIRRVLSQQKGFVPLLRMAYVEREAIVGIPEGEPPNVKLETDIPDGISFSTLQQEIRRIRNFQANGSMQKLKPWRREIQWLQLLEGLHYKEARILTMIKDGSLNTVYPGLDTVLTDAGVLGLEDLITR